MDWLTHTIVWLNGVANVLGRVLDPIGFLPGWLSATLVAVATGVGMLAVFKYTSNQRAIKRVRRGIRANLLTARLFRDNPAVGFRAQGGVLLGALRLLVLAVVPILVMIVPTVLLLTQIGLWYQARPLPAGEETVVTMKLAGEAGDPMPLVELVPSEAVEDVSGPVRVFSQREVCWNIRAREPGYHRLQFRVNGEAVEKELAVGDGFMRVSVERPGWVWWKALENPREKPFGPDSPVRSIEIEYPTRSGWLTGTDNWVIYWFVVSLLAGFCFRGLLKVNL
jgi:hypothetical protein